MKFFILILPLIFSIQTAKLSVEGEKQSTYPSVPETYTETQVLFLPWKENTNTEDSYPSIVVNSGTVPLSFYSSCSMQIDEDESIYILFWLDETLVKFDRHGLYIKSIHIPFMGNYFFLDKQKNIYVVNERLAGRGNNKIYKNGSGKSGDCKVYDQDGNSINEFNLSSGKMTTSYFFYENGVIYNRHGTEIKLIHNVTTLTEIDTPVDYYRTQIKVPYKSVATSLQIEGLDILGGTEKISTPTKIQSRSMNYGVLKIDNSLNLYFEIGLYWYHWKMDSYLLVKINKYGDILDYIPVRGKTHLRYNTNISIHGNIFQYTSDSEGLRITKWIKKANIKSATSDN